MSEAQLNILNYALLALIYLFFARVLWAVWSEVRGPRVGQPTPRQQRHKDRRQDNEHNHGDQAANPPAAAAVNHGGIGPHPQHNRLPQG